MAQKDNSSFYKKSIKEYGISARGVHWNSEYNQYKRFEILTKFIKDDIKDSTIIDAGCGFGEYYNYLFDNNLKPKSYIGIDCEKQMIELASKRFLNTKFLIKNILTDKLEPADYYICSGALSILTKDEIFKFINNCFAASNKAFIFNFLKNDPLTNVKVEEVIFHSKTLTKELRMEEKYLENDISIILKK
jgi:ubiquinone/menaquinone biosynthesis C-methylase UbiE